MNTRVVTGSRLHFGLMNLPPVEPWPPFVPGTNIPARYFGGIGMMVEEPRIAVTAEPAEQWSCRGKLGERAESIAHQLDQRQHKITIRSSSSEHVGLGVGTQLSLACGTALARRRLSPIDLARRLGRGARSSIGIHGFTNGGFIVDAGKTAAAEVGELALSTQFPQHWHVLLVTPQLKPAWFGQQEKDAFARLSSHAESDEIMGRLITTSILPALRQADLGTFAAAVTEYNARAGELFRPVQKGRYCHDVVESMIHELLCLGFAGAGQSSWGPTVFALTEELDKIEFFGHRMVTPLPCSIVVTRGRNAPASISIDEK